MARQNRRARRNTKIRELERLIDEPKPNDAGNEANKPDNRLTESVRAMAAVLPATAGHDKTIHPNDSHQSGKHRMSALKASRFVAQSFSGLVKFLDKNSGAVTALATIAIALLTWEYVAYSKKQWEAMSGQLSVMKQEQRAWLKVTFGWPAKPTTGVLIHIENVGKSPAFDPLSEFVFLVLDKNTPPPFQFVGAHSFSVMQSVFFPGQPNEYPIGLSGDKWPLQKRLEITPDQWISLEEGRTYLVTFGIVTYRDQFGAHWTRVCDWKSYYTLASDSIAFRSRTCVIYNRVGDGAAPGLGDSITEQKNESDAIEQRYRKESERRKGLIK